MLEAISEQNDSSKEAARAAAEAKTCADQGDWDGARAAMTKAIDAESNNPTHHALMAWYTFQCSLQPAFERQRLAEHHLAVALEMDPENHQAHYYQGLIWAGGGNTTRARIALATALNLKPNFQPAAQALDKLAKLGDTAGSKEQLPQQPSYVRPKKGKEKLVVPLAIGTAVLAVVAGFVLFSGGQPTGASDLAKQLGTKLPIVSVSRVGSGGQDLHMDVGIAWGKLSPGEQTSEMQNIARGAQAMKIVNVFVYSESRPVAESHGNAVCVGECVAKPSTGPGASSGQQQATLKVSGP
jgi:hypothetical protein